MQWRCSDALCRFNLSTKSLNLLYQLEPNWQNQPGIQYSVFLYHFPRGCLTDSNGNAWGRGCVTLFTNKAGGGSFVHLHRDDWLVATLALTSAQAPQTRKRWDGCRFFKCKKKLQKVSFSPHCPKSIVSYHTCFAQTLKLYFAAIILVFTNRRTLSWCVGKMFWVGMRDQTPYFLPTSSRSAELLIASLMRRHLSTGNFLKCTF